MGKSVAGGTHHTKDDDMTYSAQFKVTEVANGHIRAVASIAEGTLNQNTEHVSGMEILCTVDEGHETQIKVGDLITGSGHFTG